MISDNQITRILSKWKSKLKIKDRIIWTDSLKKFNKISDSFNTNTKRKNKCPIGAALTGIEPNLIFIDKKFHNKNRDELEKTIVHELSHIKHPSFNETKIRKVTERLMKK